MSERAGEPGPDGWDCHVHVFDTSLSARGGHYQAVDRPLWQIEAVARDHGVGHLVLVQPSVYGTDNSLLLRALGAEPGRHRGVVVVREDISGAELADMHAHGVRGVRFNLVSPVGESGLPAKQFTTLAPRLLDLGWHVQWYARHIDLPGIAALHRASGVTCVLDHLAGFDEAVATDAPSWRAVEALAAQGAWIKASGFYRLKARAPYVDLLPRMGRLAGLFGGHLVWGSDWPHTQFAPDALPSYESTWQPLVAAIGQDAASALRRTPPAIYV